MTLSAPAATLLTDVCLHHLMQLATCGTALVRDIGVIFPTDAAHARENRTNQRIATTCCTRTDMHANSIQGEVTHY